MNSPISFHCSGQWYVTAYEMDGLRVVGSFHNQDGKRVHIVLDEGYFGQEVRNSLVYTHAGLGMTRNQLIDFIDYFYTLESNLCGGNLHIVLDDYNTSDCDIKFCIKQCVTEEDFVGLQLCYALLGRSILERTRVVYRRRK